MEAINIVDSSIDVVQRAWFFVFQQPVFMTILVIAQEITQAAGVYCATSRKVQFAHVWVGYFLMTLGRE